MRVSNDGIVTINGARLINRNFAGKERTDKDGRIVNNKGQRNFCIALSEEDGQKLSELGLNVKVKEPREEGDAPLIFLQIKVSYKIKELAPVIRQYTSHGETGLYEETVEDLDNVIIEDADLKFKIRPYSVNGIDGFTAYLRKLYVKLEEDDLDKKWGQFAVDSDPESYEEEPF